MGDDANPYKTIVKASIRKAIEEALEPPSICEGCDAGDPASIFRYEDCECDSEESLDE